MCLSVTSLSVRQLHPPSATFKISDHVPKSPEAMFLYKVLQSYTKPLREDKSNRTCVHWQLRHASTFIFCGRNSLTLTYTPMVDYRQVTSYVLKGRASMPWKNRLLTLSTHHSCFAYLPQFNEIDPLRLQP